eukprot:gene23544-9068_t
MMPSGPMGSPCYQHQPLEWTRSDPHPQQIPRAQAVQEFQAVQEAQPYSRRISGEPLFNEDGQSFNPQGSTTDALKERLKAVIAERDAFALELEKHKKLTRATRVSELESRVEMLSEECNRHLMVQQSMHERIVSAERTTALATEYAKRAWLY